MEVVMQMEDNLNLLGKQKQHKFVMDMEEDLNYFGKWMIIWKMISILARPSLTRAWHS